MDAIQRLRDAPPLGLNVHDYTAETKERELIVTRAVLEMNTVTTCSFQEERKGK